MKKILLSILLVAVGLSVFSQPATRILNMRPAYPLAIGESTVDSLVYAHNGLILQDIVQDSLPTYEIGHIFAQTVRYTEEGLGFYVKADSLHSNNVVYSIDVDSLPAGPIEFNSSTGRFKYYPAAEDYRTFFVTFRATNGADTVMEIVEFDLMPQVVPEEFAFQSQGVMPDGQDYTKIVFTTTSKFLNNFQRDTCYSYSISGKDIVFDNNVPNKVCGLSGREDIYELNIFAERLYIRSALEFPQTDVTIYAKELYFEDHDNVVASINTSPSTIMTMTTGQGLNGANAGNIVLYVKELHGDIAKRFILNGAKGQSTYKSDTTGQNNNNGTPGNGGDGGIVTANIDIKSFCDFARGSSGLKFNMVSNGSNEMGEIIETGTMGQIGHFELIHNPYAYLHPYYITAVMKYSNDVFINNYFDLVSQICHEYHAEIVEYMNTSWDSCEVEVSTGLQDAQLEIEQSLFKIDQGLDYFGNSVGWVPLLSFEVMLANFDNEIDRAIPTLYLSYWMSRVDQTLQNMITYCHQHAIQTEQDIQNCQNDINSWLSQIPVLQNDFQIVSDKIDSLNYQKNLLYERLMAKARHNIKKRNRTKKALGICNSIINCIPVYGKYIGTLSNIASNVAFVAQEADINDYGVFSNFNPIDYSAMIQQLDTVLNTWDWSNVGTTANYFERKYDSIKNAVSPLVSNIQNLSNQLSKSSTPANEVEQEFIKLRDASPEWKSLEAELITCNALKSNTYSKIINFLTSIRETTSKISNDVIALDALRRDAFTGNSKRDLNAMLYMEKMEQRAKDRLLKYHYYLRKAYEYRLLKPYHGEFNLVSMFEKFEELGMALDSVVDVDAYDALKGVFRDVISGIAEEIIDEYSTNMPEQTAPVTIVIPHEQLDILNADGMLTLNFYEMGIFSPDEENVRIVDLSVYHIGTHVEGNVGYSGYMDLNMTHQGISRFRKEGQIYWFNHMSKTTTNPHTWGVRYDAIIQTSIPIQPSFASSSLLYSILNSNSSNMMLFSRPSAWGDINVSKKVHTLGGADIVIDSLILILQYDFTHRPSNIRNIDITTNEGLLPYIACSELDRNGRSNGNGNLNRSYNASNQTVSFSAIEKYGSWHFVNWTDRSGNIVSDTMDLTVNRLTDQFYRANYERRVPILSVPDTIFVNNAGGIYNVSVANVGSGDLEMDWYVSDSLSTWVHLDGLVEGIDNGNFSFTYEDNETGAYRLDSLEIFAPETDIMSKMIYIVQSITPGCNLTASLSPSSVTICQGDTATITALGQSSLSNQFSYSWNTGETTPTVKVLSEGERTVTVSDSNGCTATASVNVIVRPLPTVSISGSTTLCAGSNSTLTASGGNSYVWNTGAINSSIIINNGGDYSVTASNTYGCSSSASVSVTSLENVTIAGDRNFCQGGSTILSANGTGSYLWSTGATSSSITVTQSGIYTVTVSSDNCSSSASATVSVAANPIPTISGNSNICMGQTTSLTANGGNSYLWSNGSTQNQISVSQSGTYSVTATSLEGCTGSTNIIVTVNPLPIVNISGNSSFCQGENVQLVATGASSYSWSNGSNSNTISVSNPGTYTVIGTDNNNCTNTATKTVTVNPTYNIPIAQSICQGESYNFYGQYLTTAGTYTQNLSSVNGCDSIITLTLTIKSSPSPSILGSTSLCQGQSTTLTANGGASYIWSNAATTNSINVSQSGVYFVTATNAEGCSNIANVMVTVNPLPNVNISGNSNFCQGGNVTLTATGANTYVWSNASTNASITVNNAGNYTVTGTDANGCSNIAAKTVTVNPTYNIPLTHSICQGESYNFYGQNLTTAGTYTHTLQTVDGCDSVLTLTLTVKSLPTPSITGNTTLCEGQSTTLTANGGTSYIWSNAATTNSINVSQSGVYTVTATNVEGCSNTANITVTVNPLPTITIGGNTTICAGSNTTLTASGANTYSWSTGDNTASVNINAFGVYTVTGTSSEGCSNTATVTVLVSQLPIITITGETDICAGESTTLTANGGETYLWSDGTSANTLAVSTAGTYQVIGYNAAGCNAMASATVNVWQPATSEFSVECPDSCYTWNGQYYCTSGTYTQTLQTVHGCDSVVTMHLTITVGVNDYDGFDFKVYPNPTTGVVNVQITNHNSPITEFHVFDAYGKLIRVVDVQTTQIDLSGFASGVYFIKAVSDGNVVAVRKVVKQ